MQSDHAGRSIRLEVGGDFTGQLAQGENITQQHVSGPVPTPQPADRDALLRDIKELRTSVAALAPAHLREQALLLVGELDQAVTADVATETTVSTLEFVRNWFGDHLPQMVGAITGIIVNPVVGALAQAAGETLAAEFHRRFSHLERS